MSEYSKLSRSDGSSLGHLVNRTARLLRRLADERLAPLGLSSGYLPVLGALMAEGVLTQKTLTERAGIEQPTMAATLSRMERDGVIERRIDPKDRRSARFALTAATREKVDAIRAAVAALNEDALAILDQADRTKLRQSLQAVSASVERILDGPLSRDPVA